jgi:hypothetical protein
MEEAHKAVIWFVAMILVLMVVLSLIGGYNFSVVAPQVALAQNYKKIVIPAGEMLEYMAQLPVIINSSALSAYFPEYIFVSNGSGENVTSAILNILRMNASLVAPGPYWEVANLAGFLLANAAAHRSFLILVTNGTNWNNVTYYNMTLPFFNASPLNISYPPSVNVSAGSPTYRIIIKYSVTTNVQVYYTQSEELVGCVTRQEGNTTYVYEYYGYSISGTAYLFANNNLINTQSFSFFVWYWGGAFKYTIYGFTTVPPGVSELVFGNYSLTYWEGSSTQTVQVGSTTYIITKYYPVGPAIQTYGYTFNWYEYNVSVPIHIIVYNGTNPRTQVGDNVYNSRNIVANTSFIMWSSAPQQSSSTRIVTYDYIQVGNYTIQRTWDAGTVGVSSKVYVQRSGNTINYYLTFSVAPKIAKQPSWVFEHVPQAEVYAHNYAYDFLNGPAYYYALAKILLENFSVLQLFEIAHGLQSFVTLSNSSWPLATALRYGNGSLMEIYYQIMPLLFNIQYHNFTSENASILIGAFNVNISNRTIIIENDTDSLTGLSLGMTLRNGYVNVSEVLINGTYPFYEWPNYGSPPILFEAYPTGNYSVEFLL